MSRDKVLILACRDFPIEFNALSSSFCTLPISILILKPEKFTVFFIQFGYFQESFSEFGPRLAITWQLLYIIKNSYFV